MKSNLHHQRLKTQSTNNKANSLQQSPRRLSTQTGTSYINPQDSRINRKPSLNKSLFKTTNKTFGNYLDNHSRPMHQSRNSRSISKHNFQLLSNMSKKPYDKVIAYGWSHLKSNQQSKQPVFNINLGKVKIFTIVETSNGKSVGKTLCENYTIQIMKIIEETNSSQIKQNQINEAFSIVKKYADQSRYQFSIISIVVDEEKVIISNFGDDLGGLCFTKKQELISLADIVTQSSIPMKNSSFRQVKSNRYLASTRMNTRLYSFLNSSTTIQPSPQLYHKTYQCSQIVWISLYSNNIIQRCDQKYLKDCINKQFVLTSQAYTLGQAAMQSCKKIIHDTMRDDWYNSMMAIVVLFDQYPFQDQLKISKVKVPQTILSKMKNCNVVSKIKNQVENGPKLLKYLGNRRSFVKTITQISISKQK